MSLAQLGIKPHRIMSRLRWWSSSSNRTTGSALVGATFQLAAKFGVGRSGGIPKTDLISLTSEDRRARPHMSGYPQLKSISLLGSLAPALKFLRCATRWV